MDMDTDMDPTLTLTLTLPLTLRTGAGAVSDGGKDQGAEEAYMGCMPREDRITSVLAAVSRVIERLSYPNSKHNP